MSCYVNDILHYLIGLFEYVCVKPLQDVSCSLTTVIACHEKCSVYVSVEALFNVHDLALHRECPRGSFNIYLFKL